MACFFCPKQYVLFSIPLRGDRDNQNCNFTFSFKQIQNLFFKPTERANLWMPRKMVEYRGVYLGLASSEVTQ
jgi:hypothetical protein